MAIDFKSFSLIVPFVLDTKKPVLIRGRHGIGKSEVVYQTAANIHKFVKRYKKALPVVERRASQMTEGDLIGLPVTKDGTTAWNPPDWFMEACNKPVMLFLDEVDRAILEVRQGIFELTDSRKLNGHYLHPDTLVIAAVNGGEHGSQYQVSAMDPAELDRWTVFDLEPTVQDWLDYARGKVNEVVYDFINQHREHLEFKGEFEPNKKYPSRRSWFRFDETAKAADLLNVDKVKKDAPSQAMLYQLASGFLGMEAAVALRDFVVKYDSQVTVEDILDNGKIDKTEKFQLVDHVGLVDKMINSGRLNKELDKKELQNLADYFYILPSEAAVKLWDAISKFANPVPVNSIKLHKAKTSNGKLVAARFAEIFTGEKQ